MAGRPARTFILALVVLASPQGCGGDGNDDARTAPGAPPAGAPGTAQGAAAGPDTTATAASVDGEIVAGFDLATGALLWATDGGSEQSLFSIATDGRLAYAARDGAPSWIEPRLGFRTNAPIVVTDRGTARPPWSPPARP